MIHNRGFGELTVSTIDHVRTCQQSQTRSSSFGPTDVVQVAPHYALCLKLTLARVGMTHNTPIFVSDVVEDRFDPKLLVILRVA